ncbi:hypothetical protein [Rhodoferax sp.]|uniref:hypothetical protein n=1 Tax=Rhodoferax sp. TaxID=50421 RepID=UPI00374CD841
MALDFLRTLAQHNGPSYTHDPVEMGWVVVLQCRGLIDAEIGPSAATAGISDAPIFAVVQSLTAAGWALLADASTAEAGGSDRCMAAKRRREPNRLLSRPAAWPALVSARG